MYNIRESNVDDRICEIEINDYFIYIDNGNIVNKENGMSNDFIVKYRKKTCRSKKGRKINHIVWTADLLMKLSVKPRLTRKFINEVISYWNDLNGFKQRPSLADIKNLISINYGRFNNNDFLGLNDCGYFNVELLSILIITIAAQEKTNYPNAHRFGETLYALKEKNFNLPDIIYLADKR